MAASRCICDSARFVASRISCRAPRQSLLPHVSAISSSPSSTSSSLPFWPVQRQLRFYAGASKPYRGGNRGPTSASSGITDDKDRGYDRRFTTQKDIERSGRDRPPWDHEITDPQIMVIDNGSAEGPLATRYVLTKLEEGESLRMVTPYVPANAENNTPAKYAVCKIVNKRDEYERLKQLKEKKKVAVAGKPKTKEMELTWAIGGHDLSTKLRQMSGFLAKGMKVELMIGKKKGGRAVEAEEAREVLKKVREEIEGQGARETKKMEGTVGGTVRLYLEGVKKT
ncbi:translation initiation factor IF-3 [Trichoderma gamsii]|uniref:Translation initiation factor IF-3 n=1 Tax=Trichoderma gamsii TaxID=398673 RepID=A0A2P4ZJY2_9HYPO|nr:translation initiation factor IF-3 [Trichoderma gamsii]PON24593.1 translation initiation factor IF-3 [Trichoderma gamsii]